MEILLGNLAESLEQGTILEVYDNRDQYEQGGMCLFTIGGTAALHSYLKQETIQKLVKKVKSVGLGKMRCYISDTPSWFKGAVPDTLNQQKGKPDAF